MSIGYVALDHIARLSIYWSVCIPTLNYGQKLKEQNREYKWLNWAFEQDLKPVGWAAAQWLSIVIE